MKFKSIFFSFLVLISFNSFSQNIDEIKTLSEYIDDKDRSFNAESIQCENRSFQLLHVKKTYDEEEIKAEHATITVNPDDNSPQVLKLPNDTNTKSSFPPNASYGNDSGIFYYYTNQEFKLYLCNFCQR